MGWVAIDDGRVRRISPMPVLRRRPVKAPRRRCQRVLRIVIGPGSPIVGRYPIVPNGGQPCPSQRVLTPVLICCDRAKTGLGIPARREL